MKTKTAKMLFRHYVNAMWNLKVILKRFFTFFVL